MLAITRKKKIGLGLLLLVALLLAMALPSIAIGQPEVVGGALGLVCTQDTGTTEPEFDLVANAGYIKVPDGNRIYMWSYALDDTDQATPAFQVPSPVLCVNEGDMVTINLSNTLPEAVSIIFPGQTDVTAIGGVSGLLTSEAAVSSSVTYTFTASHPGTYLYESGSAPHKQVQMGLYGALVVRPAAGPQFAYNDASTEFSGEFLLLLHEIDPVIHSAVEDGLAPDFDARHDRYWTINGRSMPDTLNDNFIAWMPAQPYGALVQVDAYDPVVNNTALPVLIRYANAGSVNHPYHPHGNNMRVLAHDGRPLGGAEIENFTTTIGAGQTADLLFRWDNVEGWTPGVNGPVPVQLPQLEDLVFKDGVTFYSGDANLGQTGDLPPGVTTYNQCGEFYFPWHSHALNEIQNFDEGFGGMMTLVRVDKPGGCTP